MSRAGWGRLRYSARHPWARSGLWACAVAALLAVAAAVAWWPAERSRAALEERIAAKRASLVQAQQSGELARAYAQAREGVALLEKKLEHAATQAQLVENVARLARRHGVRIVSETYDENAAAAGRNSALIVELSVQGSYPSLRDFLRGLGALPTWSEIQEVRLETVHGAPFQRGRIRIVTYRGAPAAEAKAS